jgi:hypothetical protein
MVFYHISLVLYPFSHILFHIHVFSHLFFMVRRGRHRMVIGLITTCAVSGYHH